MYLWEYLKTTKKPIVMYGMGNGGDKLFAICERWGIPIQAVFSSDDHRTNKQFHGLPVEILSEVTARFPDPIILLAFGSERPEVLELIRSLAKKYEVLAPDLPLCGGEELTPAYCMEHQADIQKARALLADETSRKVFDALLSFKETGSLECLMEAETPAEEKRCLLPLSEKEHFLDLGAFIGDTIDEFLDWTKGSYGTITALEPNPKNYLKLQEHVKDLPRVQCLPYASWNQQEKLTFRGTSGRMCGIVTEVEGRTEKNYEVEARSIDSLDLDPTFVKLDVEGAEKETLEGMKDTLQKYHPSLQLSVYHKTEDFIALPLILEALCPGYQMCLRHHPSIPAWELQLYCRWNQH